MKPGRIPHGATAEFSQRTVYPVPLFWGHSQARLLKKSGRPYLPYKTTVEEAMELLPAWVDDAARAEIQNSQPLHPLPQGWWANTLVLLGDPGKSLETDSLLLGMATTMGWHHAVANLLREGATPAAGLPEKRWRWGAHGDASPRSALDYAILTSCGPTAASQPDARQFAAIELLLRAGANPDAISDRAARLALQFPPATKLLLRNGWDVTRMGKSGVPTYAYLFSPDNNSSLRARQEIFKELLERGLPLYPNRDDPKSVVAHMASSAAGIRCVDMALIHYGQSASTALQQARPSVQKAANRMKDGAAAMAKADEAAINVGIGNAGERRPGRRM